MALPPSCSPPSRRSSSRRLERGVDLAELLGRLGRRLGITFAGEFEVDLRVLELGLLFAPAGERRTQASRVRAGSPVPSGHRSRNPAPLPESSSSCETLLSRRDVKDTSRTR